MLISKRRDWRALEGMLITLVLTFTFIRLASHPGHSTCSGHVCALQSPSPSSWLKAKLRTWHLLPSGNLPIRSKFSQQISTQSNRNLLLYSTAKRDNAEKDVNENVDGEEHGGGGGGDRIGGEDSALPDDSNFGNNDRIRSEIIPGDPDAKITQNDKNEMYRSGYSNPPRRRVARRQTTSPRTSSATRVRGQGGFGDNHSSRRRRVLVETNKLIGSLARSKRWRDALEAFERLTGVDGAPDPDVISYNNLLTAYARTVLWQRAVDLLGGMLNSHVRPDTIIYNSVINACARSGQWVQAQDLYREMLNSRLKADSATYSTLINGYTRGAKWEMALEVGEQVKRKMSASIGNKGDDSSEDRRIRGSTFNTREDGSIAANRLNAVVYTALINAASRGKQWQRAVEVLGTMVELALRIDSITYSSLLSACGNNVEQAKVVCDRMDSLGMRRDTSTYNALIGVYAKSHQWGDAMDLFEQMKNKAVRLNIFTYNTVIAMQAADKNSEGAEWLFKEMQRDRIRADVISYNLRINAFAQRGQREKAFGVVQEMNNAMIRSNKYTYDFLITACEEAERFDEGIQTFNTMINSGIRMDVVSFTKHIKFHKERGDWRAALRTFSHMLQSSVRANDVSYKTLISVCSIIPQGAANAATAVFLEMQMSAIRPDVTAYNTLISACAQEHWTRALRAYRQMQDDEVPPNVVTYNALLSAFEHGADLGMCRRLFRSMSVRKDAMTYAAFINCAGRAGRWQVALDTFEGMQRDSLDPDTQLYNTLITAISRSSPTRWQIAIELMKEMQRKNVPRDTKTCIAVMRACEQAAQYEAAIDVFNTFPTGEVLHAADGNVGELLVNAQSQLGRWEDTLKVLHEILPRSPPPHLYSLVLEVLSRERFLWDKCLELFSRMKRENVSVELNAYNSVMQVHSSKGEWNRALELFDAMLQGGTQPDSQTYDILIAAYTRRREDQAFAAVKKNSTGTEN